MIEIYRTDVSSALKDKMFNEDTIGNHIDVVHGAFGGLEDAKKMQIFTDDGEYHVPLSQLNNTVYHVNKDAAEEEIMKFISLNKKLTVN